MPYSGRLNTIQKEVPQLLQQDSSTSSSLLPESFFLFPAYAFFVFNHSNNARKKKTYNMLIVL